MTAAGMILGTAAYMTPEQARGQPVDKRTDIWAFGCVLYEMLTGKRAFGGDDVTDTLAFIITRSRTGAPLPAEHTPATSGRCCERCLERIRKSGCADIGDARFEIDAEALHGFDRRRQRRSAQPGRLARALPWAVGGASAPGSARGARAVGARGAAGRPRRCASRSDWAPTRRWHSTNGRAATRSRQTARRWRSWRRKGTGALSQLYVRRLDQLQARPLSGSDDASSPFFSPDGQWIAFFAGGKLKKISVTGGAAVTLCDAPAAAAASGPTTARSCFNPSARPAGT